MQIDHSVAWADSSCHQSACCARPGVWRREPGWIRVQVRHVDQASGRRLTRDEHACRCRWMFCWWRHSRGGRAASKEVRMGDARWTSVLGRTSRSSSRAGPAALRALNAHYGAELGELFRTAGLCLYRDGRDSVARRHDRPGEDRGHHGRHRVAGHAGAVPAARAAAPRCGTRSGMAACWSWAAAASAPGSTPCPRRPGPSGRGSACSSVPAGSADSKRPAMQPFPGWRWSGWL